MARSLNKVILIGNLTRDPELRYTPSGTAVATFTLATNRQWKTESGDTKEDAEFHRIVAWDKLAEICSQFLKKGRQAYVEGRLQTRKWQTKEGEDRYVTEVVISEMILLGKTDGATLQDSMPEIPEDFDEDHTKEDKGGKKESKNADREKDKKDKLEKQDKPDEEESEEDIPF